MKNIDFKINRIIISIIIIRVNSYYLIYILQTQLDSHHTAHSSDFTDSLPLEKLRHRFSANVVEYEESPLVLAGDVASLVLYTAPSSLPRREQMQLLGRFCRQHPTKIGNVADIRK